MFQVAMVDEARCIGCNACFQACPTGALVGATKQIHTVISELCTGCGACIPTCPVPCLALVPWKEARHPMQGENAPAAAAATAVHAARMANRGARARAETVAKPLVEGFSLSPELAALAEAARQKSELKYKKMGPIRRPRALPKPR